MQQHIALLTLASVLSLSACDKHPERPTPLLKTEEQQKTNSTAITGSQTGVPSAESVFSGSTATQPIQPTGRPSGAMTPAQEKSGMPLPGQNNDHSAPLATVTTTIRPQ